MFKSIFLSGFFALAFESSFCLGDTLMPVGSHMGDTRVPRSSCPDRCGVRWSGQYFPLAEPMVYFDEIVEEAIMFAAGYLVVGSSNGVELPSSGWHSRSVIPATNISGLVAVHWRSTEFDESGTLSHRVTDSSREDFGVLTDFIQTCDGGEDFEPIHAIVASWYQWGTCTYPYCYWDGAFQLVMAYAGDKTWAVMSYGPRLYYPVEGSPAKRGFNSKDGEAGYVIGEVLGDIDGWYNQSALFDLQTGTNCGVAYSGVYGYDVSTRDESGSGGGDGGGGDDGGGDGGDETGTLIMVNARGDVDVDIGPIEDGQQYDRSELGRSYSVRAEGFADEVGSVVFSLDGVEYNIENSSPYYMNTKRRENARRVPEFAELGTYTVTATAWSEADGSGTVVETLSATFEIVR